MTIAQMFDCSTPLTLSQAQALKTSGYSVVARYLGNWGKSLTTSEVSVLKQAGLMIVSIWEGNPTSAAYFTEAQGTADAKAALMSAMTVGQPKGSTIYFAVDYDAQDADMGAVRAYLQSVYSVIHPAGYHMGVYGSYRVMSNVTADFYWQTVAWSENQISPRACMLQHAPSETVAGVEIDHNEVFSGAGWWNQPLENMVDTQNSVEGDVKKITDFLGAVYTLVGGSDEAHRLANVVRKLANIPTV